MKINKVYEKGSIAIIVMILFIVVVLLLVGGAVYQREILKSKTPFLSSGNDMGSQNLPSCGSKYDLFTVSPINGADISTIIPLGNLAPPGHVLPTTHMYYRYLHTDSGKKITNIYAPADLTIDSITLSDNQSLDTPYNSYKITFSVCKEVQGYFILLMTLSDKLKSAFTEPYDRTDTSNVGRSKSEHNYMKFVSIKVRAGELLGTGGGGPESPDALDFGLTDSRTKAPVLANPTRWPKSEQHYVCSLDYFNEPLKSELYQKLGDFDGNIININEPKCGAVYQDIPGTAQGIWVAKNSTSQDLWDIPNNLALVHGNYDHASAVFSLGNSLQQIGFDNSKIYHFSQKPTGNVNVDFSQVRPNDTVYCYDTKNPTGGKGPSILVQMKDEKTLRIGKLLSPPCEEGPWQFGQSLDFVR